MFLVSVLSLMVGGSPAWSQETAELAPVVVTSDLDKQGTPLVKAPGSFVRKDRLDLELSAPTDLESAVGLEPNVEFLGGPRSRAKTPQIRGLGGSRVLLLEDGVRQNFQSGHQGQVFTDFSLIESLEIVKGPWSSLYGSGALGGVITFRRATAADFIRRQGRPHGAELGLDGATAAGQMGERLTVFNKMGFFEPLVSYHHSKSGDVRLGGGDVLAYSGAESGDLYSSLGFDLGANRKFELKLSRYEENSRQPIKPDEDTEVASKIADARIRKEDIIGDYRSLVDGFGEVRAKLYSRKSEIHQKRVSDGRVDIQTVQTIGLDTWNNWTLRTVEDRDSILTVGAEVFRDQNRGERNGGALGSFPSGTGEQWGVYLQPVIALSSGWTITPGLRHDSFRSRTKDATLVDSSESATSLKLYVSREYQPDRILFAGWGQGFNAPRLQDMYRTEMHFPGNFFEPNPSLVPERAETFEVGTKNTIKAWDTAVLSVDATLFQTRARDFISQVVNAGAGTTTFQNVNRVRLEGFEASVRLRDERVSPGIAYGSTRSRDENTGEPLDDTPADEWSAMVETYPSDRWILGTDAKLVEKQDRVSSAGQETPGFFVQSFYVNYADDRLTATLRLNNAFDRKYRRHGSGVDEVGRDLRLTLAWSL